MKGAEQGKGRVDSQEGTNSEERHIHDRLQGLAESGKIRYVGELPLSGDGDLPRRFPTIKGAVVYVGLVNRLPKGLRSKEKKIGDVTKSLVEKIDSAIRIGWVKEKRRIGHELILSREKTVNKAERGRVSGMRSLDHVRVYGDKETAELELELDKGDIGQKEYKARRRKMRSEVLNKIWRIPHSSQ